MITQAPRNSTARGYDRQWRKARAAYLRAHSLCEMCKAQGVVRVARVVDHIRPHHGNRMLFWDYATNWQSLCDQCHNHKTMTQDKAKREGKAPYVGSACDVHGMPLDPNHHWRQS